LVIFLKKNFFVCRSNCYDTEIGVEAGQTILLFC